ncbi:MAG: HlyD family efflux transporter periplasmic adaptor subunit, partial [Chloroflexota bacterium]
GTRVGAGSCAATGVDIANAAVDRASADLAAARAGIDRSEAAVDEAEAARDALPDTASSALERQAKAVTQGAQAGLAQARATRDAAEAALAQAEAEVVRAEAARAAADAAVDVAGAELARAEAGFTSAELALARRTVGAPFAGTVAASTLAVGEIATPGLPIVRLADTSAWAFETTDLGTAGAARVVAGDLATITVDDVDGATVPGMVRVIAIYGDERQGDITFRAIVDPTGPVPPAIRWNTIVTVTIAPGTADVEEAGASPVPSPAP